MCTYKKDPKTGFKQCEIHPGGFRQAYGGEDCSIVNEAAERAWELAHPCPPGPPTCSNGHTLRKGEDGCSRCASIVSSFGARGTIDLSARRCAADGCGSRAAAGSRYCSRCRHDEE